MSPTSAATFLALHPENNNILAVGKEDSLIHIFNVHKDQVFILKIMQIQIFYLDHFKNRMYNDLSLFSF